MARILITGGSRGIGAAMVRVMARAGHDVCFFYKESIDMAKSLVRMMSAEGHSVLSMQCDVSNSYEVDQAVANLLAQWDGIDVLIANAGISHHGLLQDMMDVEWQNIFATNVNGAFYCTKAVLPQMIARQQGNIIYMSSIWGARGASCEVAYSATKGAIDSLTKSLAQEVVYSGIRVNAIAPGVVGTDMMQELGAETNVEVLKEMPMRRFAYPEEIAKLALFLISEDANYMTGQILTMAGGYVI